MHIPGYEVLETLGEGNSGCVYKARQTQLNRLVAIKVLKDDEPDEVERFLREARAVAKFRHRNLVTLIDIGRSPEGADYIVLEFVAGLSLEALLKRFGKLSERVALSVIDAVCAALVQIDAGNFAHRDIKPANILIRWDGVAKVVDLGLVKGLRDDASRTSTGRILGTPMYIAPEQVDGDPVDIRADIYSLGLVLYHCVVGQAPFHGKSIWKMLADRREESVPDPRKANPQVSRHVAMLVANMSARDPGARYPNAEAAQLDVQRVIGGGTPYGPTGAAGRFLGGARVNAPDPAPLRELLEPFVPRSEDPATRAAPETRAALDVQRNLTAAPSSSAPGARFKLTLFQDGIKLLERPFDQNEVVIGRTGACDLMLDDPRVSRRHAVVLRQGERFVLEAPSTPNGTKIGAEPIEGRVPLDPGDKITVADRFVLQFSVLAPPEGSSASRDPLPLNPGTRPDSSPLAQSRPGSGRAPAARSGSGRAARDPGYSTRSGSVRMGVTLEGTPLRFPRVVGITVRGLSLEAGEDLPWGQRVTIQLRHPILVQALEIPAMVASSERVANGFRIDLAFQEMGVQERILIRRVQAAEHSLRVVVGERVVGFVAQRPDGWALFDVTTAKVAVLERVGGQVRVSFLGANPEESVHMIQAADLANAVQMALELGQVPRLVEPGGGQWHPIRESLPRPEDTSTPALRYHKVMGGAQVLGYLTVTSIDEAWLLHDTEWTELAVLQPQEGGGCKVTPVGMEGAQFVRFIMSPSLRAGAGFVLRLLELPAFDPPIQPWAGR